MLTGRDAELAERLREAAASGRTQLVIQLLESGAPFIVDSVSVMRVREIERAITICIFQLIIILIGIPSVFAIF